MTVGERDEIRELTLQVAQTAGTVHALVDWQKDAHKELVARVRKVEEAVTELKRADERIDLVIAPARTPLKATGYLWQHLAAAVRKGTTVVIGMAGAAMYALLHRLL